MYARATYCDDRPMHTPGDDQLRDIRGHLLARSAELDDRVRRVNEDLGRNSAPVHRDHPDAAIVMENDEILHAVGDSASAEIGLISRALQRLEAGTYGTCERCGEKIEAERLRVVPYADVCRRCSPDG
jgi:DnaK suppressor protein